MSAARTALTFIALALGPVIAGLVLAAATQLHTDPQLSGFIYALTLILFLLAASADWIGEVLGGKSEATPVRAAISNAADKVLIACALVTLAYAALPLMLVAAAAIILGSDVIVASLRGALSAQGKTPPSDQIDKWKSAAEIAGVAAFLAYQSAALLTAQISVVLGLDWAARLLLWAAALLALVDTVQHAGAVLKRA